MKVIHLLRKPCSEGTVAANVLRYGTGALNIDASRVAFTSEADEQESKTKNQHADFGSAPVTGNVTYGDYSMMPPKNYNPPGRWPANLVLQHPPECRCEGAKRVRGSGARESSIGKGREGNHTNGIYGAHGSKVTTAYVDEDGTEAVAAWACAPKCPVAALDAQSGTSKSSGGRAVDQFRDRNPIYGGGRGLEESRDPGFGDVGGASRYFKQISGKGRGEPSDG